MQYKVNVHTLIRDPIEKTVKTFGNLVSFYSVLYCAPGSNVKVSLGTYRKAERSFVASTTSGTYIEKIILFMVWLFDARTEFHFQDYIPKFETMNHEYLLEFQYREEDENVTNIRNRNQINEIPGIQNMMRQLVDAMQPL